MMTMNAASVLLDGHAPNRVALVCGDEQMTYGALRGAVARAASAWRTLGVAPGDRVAIKLPDGLDWVIAYLGALWAGAVAVAVNPRVPAEEWDRIVAEAGLRRVLTEVAEPDLPCIELAAWSRAVELAAPREPLLVDAESPAFWSHSSGTSGAPKAVIHAHRCALQVEAVARDVIGIDADDRLYASSKLFFVYPLANSLFSGLKLGATVILDPAWPSPSQAAQTIAKHRPTVFFSVPALYRALLLDGFAPKLAAAGIRVAVSAGEALPPALRDLWRSKTGIPLVNGYGASETLCLVLVDRDDGAGLRPSPGASITLCNASDDAPSRVMIRAPTLALGYFNRPTAQQDAFRDGAYSPADLFQFDAASGWRFAGREDSLIKVRGRWVDLVELEEKLLGACPGLAEAAAVAVTDAQGVTEIAFAYVAHASQRCGMRAVLGALIDALPAHRRPRWIHELPALPRTPTGKLMRRALRELHEMEKVT